MPLNINIKSTELYNNFEQGDLLYGLQDIRKIFIKDLIEKVENNHVTIDSYNNKIIIANLSLEDKFKENPEQKLNTKEQEYKTFLLAHDKYTPTRNDSKNKDEDIKIRRSCKAALFWKKADNHKVHFCLDNLNEARVLSKWDIKQSKVEHKFTAAELRFIYKNWQELSNTVYFYEEGKKVLAPWEIRESYWKNNYKKTSDYDNKKYQPEKRKNISNNLSKLRPVNLFSEQTSETASSDTVNNTLSELAPVAVANNNIKSRVSKKLKF